MATGSLTRTRTTEVAIDFLLLLVYKSCLSSSIHLVSVLHGLAWSKVLSELHSGTSVCLPPG